MFNIFEHAWRTGRKLGRTIYCMIGSEADDEDFLLGMMDTPEVAEHICKLHNDHLRLNTVLGDDRIRPQMGLPKLPDA